MIACRAPIPRRRAVSMTERTLAWSFAPQTDQAPAELLGDGVSCDRRREHGLQFEAMPPEEGIEHTRAALEHEALAVPPDTDGAAQQRDHPPGQHGVNAVHRVLRVAQQVRQTRLVLLAPTSLRPQPVRHPRGRPHTAQEPLDHILAAARRDGEVATVDVLEHPGACCTIRLCNAIRVDKALGFH